MSGARTHLDSVFAEHGPDAHGHGHDGTSIHVHRAIDGGQVGLPCWPDLGNWGHRSHPAEPREWALPSQGLVAM